MEKEETQIKIKMNTWRGLNKRKLSSSENFDDVINRMLLEFPEEEKVIEQ